MTEPRPNRAPDAPTRILIADDHEVVRIGLAALLDAQDGLTVVAQAASGDEAVRMARQHRPDVVVMDIRMPNGSGIDACRAITSDLELLTAFADYKVPQVLRYLGVLRYAEPLARWIRYLERIPPSHPYEVAIRAGTVQACERIVAAARALGSEITAAELDWRLWRLGQSLPGDVEPYHRTVTTHY